jgi:phosphopantetheinyl transferase
MKRRDGRGTTPRAPAIRFVRTADVDLERLADWGLALLSSEEGATFDRRRRGTDKRDYLAAHLVLRLAVAEVLAIQPQQVRVESESSGRPTVVGAPIHVSLTHCEGLGACAVSAVGDGSPVGVDAEPLSAAARVEEVKDLALTRAEQGWVGAGPAERNARLVALWTAKEAVLKARGVGIVGSRGVNELLSVECRPESWTGGCAGSFRAGSERIVTFHLPGDFCLAWARSAVGQVDHPVPEELVFPLATS